MSIDVYCTATACCLISIKSTPLLIRLSATETMSGFKLPDHYNNCWATGVSGFDHH